VLLGLSLRTTEIVREVADRLASNRYGFFAGKYASSVPNDQAIGHRQIQVIPAAAGWSTPNLRRAWGRGVRLGFDTFYVAAVRAVRFGSARADYVTAS
jgi:hypothetical protein